MAARGKKGKAFYFIGTLQPYWHSSTLPDYKGTMFTPAERRKMVSAFVPGQPEMIMGHGGGVSHGFKPSPEQIVGKPTGMFLDKEGAIRCTGKVYASRPEAVALLEGIRDRGERWGLSAWTDFYLNDTNPPSVDQESKRMTHIGLTQNPAFGEEGTWIHVYSDNKEAIKRMMRDEYLPRGAYANTASMRYWGVDRSEFGAGALISPPCLPTVILACQRHLTHVRSIRRVVHRGTGSDGRDYRDQDPEDTTTRRGHSESAGSVFSSAATNVT